MIWAADRARAEGYDFAGVLHGAGGVEGLGVSAYDQDEERDKHDCRATLGWAGEGARPYVAAGGSHRSFLAWRALRCLGCTSQAMPILMMYRATMGAAKMHMFRMSVVGVMIAAIMKITRIE